MEFACNTKVQFLIFVLSLRFKKCYKMKIENTFKTALTILLFLYFGLIACKNSTNNKNTLVNTNTAESVALKMLNALKENDFNSFKTLFIDANEYASIIKNSKAEPEIIKEMLDQFQDNYANITTSFLTKEAFEKFRTDMEVKYGDNFWKTVKIVDGPAIIPTDEQIIASKEVEVIYKLLNEGDTLQMPLKTFCLQKNGWKYLGLITIDKNLNDIDENDINSTDAPNANIDTTKGVKAFEKEFENRPLDDEE